MKALTFSLLALSLAAVAVPAAAQFPGPRPETIKGMPTVPARLPDGHLNWTGFWVPSGGFLEVYRGPSGVTGMPPGLNIPTQRHDIPALKSPYKEQYEAVGRQAAAGTLPDLVAECFPPGMPAMMVMVYGMEILQTPKVISITSEWQAATRRVWMDMKNHPPPEELDDTYAGHSIGHWEGDTLVVDTVGVRSDVSLDFSHLPHSPKMRIIERFNQVSPGVLTDTVTVDDPDMFVTPWTYKNVYVYKPDLQLREYNCLENNRNVGPNGQAVFK